MLELFLVVLIIRLSAYEAVFTPFQEEQSVLISLLRPNTIHWTIINHFFIKFINILRQIDYKVQKFLFFYFDSV